MAERKSGPVKLPVVELTARPAGKPAEAEKPGTAGKDDAKPGRGAAAKAAGPVAAADATTASASEKPATIANETKPGEGVPLSSSSGRPAEIPRSSPRLTANPATVVRRRPNLFGAGFGGAVGGAILATAICYGLAYDGYWPGTSAATDQRLTALAQSLAAEQKGAADTAAALADVTGKVGALQSDLAAKLGAATTGLAALRQAVARLGVPAPAVDLGPIQAQLKTLSARVDAVAAGASSADAGALAANLATVQQSVADLTQKLSALGDRAGATDTAVQNLKGELDAAKASIDKAAAAPSPKTIASAMQLPLLLSALETDFAGGRPYDADLKALVAAVPETHVPASVTDAAATGLPAPQELVDAFETKMPEMIAARPATADAGWQGQAADWFRNVLALRQQGEQQGSGPDAVLSRLEAAVGRHDFAGSVTLLGQLPAPMQAAAGDVATKLRGLADAQTFVAGLRQQALAPAAGTQQ